MPYITVRENKAKWWITVQGLNYNEVRLLSEKLSDQPESHSDKEKMAEFSVPTWMVRRLWEKVGDTSQLSYLSGF